MRGRDLRAAAIAAGLGLAVIGVLAGMGLILRANMQTSGGGVGTHDGDGVITPTIGVTEFGEIEAKSPQADGSAVSAAPVGSEASCQNAEAGYALAYPADWFVLPPDPERGIAACALFAAEPFDYVPSIPTGFGASVYVTHWEGNCLEFDMVDPTPDVLQEVRVGGLPAVRIQFRPPGALEMHSYLVNLAPEAGDVLQVQGDASCENSDALSIRTDGRGPGDYELNRRVVDRIAATLTINTVGVD